MIIKTVNLALVCGVTSKIPAGTLPEFAFAGRSNVGKSTLINGLMNRKSLARVSSQPGKTQTINYYEINGAFHLVDLPGYGYAKANVKVKEQWGKMIERYLHTSRQLRAVFLLLDIRHEPTGQDVMMYDWILQAGFTPVIIATKADKIKRSQIQKQVALLRRTLREESHVQNASFRDSCTHCQRAVFIAGQRVAQQRPAVVLNRERKFQGVVKDMIIVPCFIRFIL